MTKTSRLAAFVMVAALQDCSCEQKLPPADVPELPVIQCDPNQQPKVPPEAAQEPCSPACGSDENVVACMRVVPQWPLQPARAAAVQFEEAAMQLPQPCR